MMNIFKFFRGRDKASTIEMIPEPADTQKIAGVNNELENREKNQLLTVSYSTGWPIDVLYGYMHENFEASGFNDAMINSDMAFCKMNMSIIKDKIDMVLREVRLDYDVMRRQLEAKIETCKSNGLLDTVTKLEDQLSTIDSHIAEMEKLDRELTVDSENLPLPLQTYRCGFLRGVASVSLGAVNSSHTRKSADATMYPASKAV